MENEWVDLSQVLERYRDRGVYEAEEVMGVWQFRINECPIHLKIKVIRHLPAGKFIGLANYEIKRPGQAGFYTSLHFCDTVQEALEDVLHGFFSFWDPKEANKTEFKPVEDW
jgi:hypothetical protein